MPCMKFLFVRPDVCHRLLSDSTSRWTPLPLTKRFPLSGLTRDLHPLDNKHAEHTPEKPPNIQRLFILYDAYPYTYHPRSHLKSSHRPPLFPRVSRSCACDDYPVQYFVLKNIVAKLRRQWISVCFLIFYLDEKFSDRKNTEGRVQTYKRDGRMYKCPARRLVQKYKQYKIYRYKK